jgi:hypothetical protein
VSGVLSASARLPGLRWPKPGDRHDLRVLPAHTPREAPSMVVPASRRDATSHGAGTDSSTAHDDRRAAGSRALRRSHVRLAQVRAAGRGQFLARLAREIEHVQYVKIESPAAAAKLRALVELAGDALPGPFDAKRGSLCCRTWTPAPAGRCPARFSRSCCGRLCPIKRPVIEPRQ